MSYIKIFTGHTFPKNEILGNRIRSGVKLPSLRQFNPSPRVSPSGIPTFVDVA